MVRINFEFGSDTALDSWLNRFRLSEAPSDMNGDLTAINLHCAAGGLPWESSIVYERRDDVGDRYTLYDGCRTSAVKRLRSGNLVAREALQPRTPFAGTVWTSWASVKFREPFTPDSSKEAFTLDDRESTCDDPLLLNNTSPDEIRIPGSDCSPLLVTGPVDTALSRNCNVCQVSLFSTRSVVQPPGFCEYSGDMICADCFHTRQVVIPWRIINGQESYRGNVSRISAHIIHSNYYSLCIQYSQLSLLPVVRSIQAIRIRCLTFREKIASCKQLRETLLNVISPLPSHFRDELMSSQNPSESCSLAYCLADLVDMVGGSSIIGRTFLACIDVLQTHHCLDCDSRFTKVCVVCSRLVSSTDIEWTFCDECSTWFHRSCYGRCIGGCPACANHSNFSIDDLSDLVVSS